MMTAAALFGSLAFAQPLPPPQQQGPPPQQGQQQDPPSRAARLGFMSGTVSFQPGGVEDWVPATMNRPLTTGDRVWVEGGGRAEMHLGSAAFRLDGRTNFAFLNLDDATAQVQISLGTMSVRLRRLAENETFEIDTPQVAFSLLRPGEYRIQVSDQGDATIVTVRGGEGEATAGGQAFAIHPREEVRISGAAGADQPPAFDRRTAPPGDPFDNWCEDRDRREDMSQSAKYVSREMPGYGDLDQAGTWRTVPDYGPVWTPGGVPVGWAPYHTGHWAWIAPWGWTWVDDAPWGYAPFHYGRWVFVGGGWAWVPGPVAVRPVYAPALVAWVGGPSFGVGISIGGPAVGWFALGPREVFVPAYGYSPRYIEQNNVTNTVIVNRAVFANVAVANVTYVNRGVVGAVTVVPQGVMAGGRPVAVAAIAVQPAMLARVQVTGYAAVTPERGAVFGGRATLAASAAPPAAIVNRPIVARATPPPPPPSFAAQQTALRANPGRPPEAAAMRQMQQSSPAARPYVRPAGVPPPNMSQRTNTPPANTGGPGPGVGGAGRPGPITPQERPAAVTPTPTPRPPANTPPSNPTPQNTTRQNTPTPEARPGSQPGSRTPTDTKAKQKSKQERDKEKEHERN
jgi:hypothetical protein